MSYVIKYDLDPYMPTQELISVEPGGGIVIPYSQFGYGQMKTIKIVVQALPGFVRNPPFMMKVASNDIRAVVTGSGDLLGDAVWGADASADLGVDSGDGLQIMAEIRRELNGQEIVLDSALGFPAHGYYVPEFDASTIWYVTDSSDIGEGGRAGFQFARFIDIVDISPQRWATVTTVMSGSTGGIDLRLHLYKGSNGALVTDLGYSDIHNVGISDNKTLTMAFDLGANNTALASGEVFVADLEFRFSGGSWSPAVSYVTPESDGFMAVASGTHSLSLPVRGADNSGNMYVEASQGGMTAMFSPGLITI